MGVPKFYRWISERYPCLSEIVKEYQIPEFDNLYLDMNGIIHTSSHPEDDNPHFRITEEKIFEIICHYIEVLFRMIKPKKVFFMAIDGVAPRAKMNQQRGRRFRSAREAEQLVQKALEKGESLPKEERFDSNCITPGTEFMVRLHDHLQYFVAQKVSNDRLWQGVRIYLSGHETPGEGEHKIMDFIRYEKSQKDYNPNTRHCLYGLDADLIMLGLITHEPHFSLLREEVRFGKNAQKRSTAVEETTFHLLHLSLMREYLAHEFESVKDQLSFKYSVENVIDDWVLMGFLVGNDFIPHLPHMHIHQECLPLLWDTYKRVLPKLGGYINEGGFLSLERFEIYLNAVAKIDKENFEEQFSDIKWAEAKMRKLEKFDDLEDGPRPVKVTTTMTHSLSSQSVGIPSAEEFMKLRTEDGATAEDGDDGFNDEEENEEEEEEESESPDDDDDPFNSEFNKYKANYYIEKMEFQKVTPAVLESQAFGYVKAIQWILHYYYNGCQSWSWFYPHHYAPYLSDIKNFKHMKMEYDMGEPFLPFQQLMAVLPTASKALLPKPLQSLMVNDTSPVIDYYPVEFLTDLNGKQQEWEAVVLIPFIDEKRLLNAMGPQIELLSDSEKARNSHGPHLLFTYSPDSLGTLQSNPPNKYPPIVNNHAVKTKIAKDGFVMDINKLHKGLCEGVRQDLYFCGFPTLKHLEHSIQLAKAGVKVFQHPSRSDNMTLILKEVVNPPIGDLARELIGRTVFVGYPHLTEALVVAVANQGTKFSMVGGIGQGNEVTLRSEQLTRDSLEIWQKDCNMLSEKYRSRLGIITGDTEYLIYARLMSGRRYVCGQRGLVTLEKQWLTISEPFLYQTIVKDLSVHDETFTQFKTLDELYKKDSTVFLLGNPHYGSSGHVVDVEMKDDPRVRISISVVPEPDLTRISSQPGGGMTRYFPGYSIAQKLGISPHLLSRITGTVFLLEGSRADKDPNKVNLGLNLKFNKTNQEVPGYTKKVEGEWLYSAKVQEILSQYLAKFPQLFEKIKESKVHDNFYVVDIFPNNSEIVSELKKYLKELPCKNVAPANHGSCLLDELTIAEIEQEVKKHKELTKKKKKSVKMQVRPHLLYQPLTVQTHTSPDEAATFELFDRVVNIRDGYSVPLGLRGTITAISTAEKIQDIVYEVVFDDEFLGGLTLRCSPNRAYRMPSSALINLSYGERKERGEVGGRGQGAHLQRGPSGSQTGYNRTHNAWNNRQHQPQHAQQQTVRPQEFRPTAIMTRPALNHQQQVRATQPPQREKQEPKNPQREKQEQKNPAKTSANENNQNFADIWNQLRGGGGNSNGVPVTDVTGPPAPCTSDLRPPTEWLKGPPTTAEPVDNDKASEELKRLLGGLRMSGGKSDAQNTATSASDTISSNKPSMTYSRQLTVEELFKGAEKKSIESGSAVTPMDVSKSDVKQAENKSKTDESNATQDKQQLLKQQLLQKHGMVHQQQATEQQQNVHQKNQQQQNVKQPNVKQQQNVGRQEVTNQRPQRPVNQQQQQQQLQQQFNQQQFMQQQQQQRLPHQAQLTPQQMQQLQFVQQRASANNLQQQQLLFQQQFVPNVQVMMRLQQQQQQQQQQQHQQQMMNQQRPLQNTYGQQVAGLRSMCESRGMTQPQFTFERRPDGLMRSLVSLGHGLTLAGSYVRDQQQAMESAAAVALFRLNSMMPAAGVGSGGVRQENSASFTASPNSAFTPITAAYPGTQQTVMRATYPQNRATKNVQHTQQQPQLLQLQQHQQQQQLLHQQQLQQQQQQELSGQTAGADQAAQKSTAGAVKNPFIPTQVLRQQKTPQKRDDSMTDSKLTGTESVTGDNDSSVTSPPDNKPNHINTPSSASARKREKKNKSRIAANFGSAPTEPGS